MRLVLGVVMLTLASCGGSASSKAPPSRAASSAKLAERLQGTWEIVRYESRDPIPDDAMALMGEMFEDLRLSVHDSAWRVDGSDSPFQVLGDDPQSFRLKTSGMFDNATCRLTSADLWEVVDNGPTWPGKTVLKRSH